MRATRLLLTLLRVLLNETKNPATIAQQSAIVNSKSSKVTPFEKAETSVASLAHSITNRSTISSKFAPTMDTTNTVAATLGKIPRRRMDKYLKNANTAKTATTTATTFAQKTIIPSICIKNVKVSKLAPYARTQRPRTYFIKYIYYFNNMYPYCQQINNLSRDLGRK